MSAKHLNPSTPSLAAPSLAAPSLAPIGTGASQPGLPNRAFPLRRIIGALLVLALSVAALALVLPKPAAAKDAIGLNAADRKQVQQIEDYLNAISSMKSRFMQVTDTGHFAQGDFFMSRPGRMRIDYDDPVPVVIVSDGTWVMYKDESLDQISHMPLSQLPASMFIGAHVDFFNDELLITNFEDEAGAMRLTLQRADDPTEGALTLVFVAKPLQLKKWSVVDAQGTTTTVSLMGPKFGEVLSPGLFKVEQQTLQKPDK